MTDSVGSALNTNVHFHTLVAQGVFFQDADGARCFAPAPAPSDADVARLLTTIRRRIVRLVARHGIDLDDPGAEAAADDERLFDFPAYAQIQGAAVLGRVAIGARAGAAVTRLGRAGEATEANPSVPLHAHLHGFDLHAAVAVPAGDRERLEHLCRYILRPPVAQQALALTADGKIVLRLRRPWRDGTRAIQFEPSELLEKLAAIVPKPRINLLIYHGAFAPHARHRADAVREAIAGRRQRTGCPSSGSGDPNAAGAEPPPGDGYVRPKYVRWADLLERTFSVDVLACSAFAAPSSI